MADTSDQRAALLRTDVIVEGAAWVAAGIQEDDVRRAANALWRRVSDTPEPVEMSVLLASDDRVQALNAQFRDKNQATNVLSFPSGDDEYIGDIALGAETVSREAAELGIAVEDHVAHLVVHGTLHLLGYDHETIEDAEEMESLEVLVLKDLGIANPYEGRELSSPDMQPEQNKGAA